MGGDESREQEIKTAHIFPANLRRDCEKTRKKMLPNDSNNHKKVAMAKESELSLSTEYNEQ
jgi:hypothetical protein